MYFLLLYVKEYLLTIGDIQTPWQEFVSSACLTQEVNLSGSINIQSY